MANSAPINFVVVAYLSGMKPEESGELPVKGSLLEGISIEEYFSPEEIFAPGEDIELHLRVTTVAEYSYDILCFSLFLNSNGNFQYETVYARFNETVYVNGVDGIDVSVDTHNSDDGISRAISILISNATENHVGLLECRYGRSKTSDWWESYMGQAWFVTGTQLRMEDNTVYPKLLTYKMGFEWSGSGNESLIPIGSDNVFECIILTPEVPRNVSLYFEGRQLSVAAPVPLVHLTMYPETYDQVYAHYFAQVTASDAGIYRWKVEFEDETLENEIYVRVVGEKWRMTH